MSPTGLDILFDLGLCMLSKSDALLSFNTTGNGHFEIDDQSDSEGELSSSSSDSPPATKRQKPNPPSRKIRRLEKFNLTDDSPPFKNLDQYVLQVAGASLAAVKEVADGRADVGICWDGGRHHALRSGASGFCYVNDPVLCILSLASQGLPVQPPKPTFLPLTNFPEPEQAPTRTRKPRILYLDLDIHHGDGPAQAFQTFSSARSRPPAVVTLSVHHASPGFFPPGPLSALTQPDTKSPHTLSIPLKAGASGWSMKSVWEGSIEPIKKAWEPDYVVVCVGVDGLAGDPKGVWNLGLKEEGGLTWCVDRALDWNIPIVLLGGGGYNHANAARAYASCTAAALGRCLSADTLIQDDAFTHDEDYCLFEPQFDMEVHLGNMRDENTAEYLAEINSTFQVLAERIKSSREYQIAS
ncbi:Histone deacetylase complex, catalytic component RPD3 [Phaffia rhodozyma]|uniref:Histone deacetylase complex, catalytic component RPD3 n=1 Tax=Phaffia rhodozyma TaxID=264483 RepID=A0A0F7STN7_PHARH|nr:Histone deacetylase complex, catalytic component RPD3 [Phaffia rhodozyma]